jgi:hypothetical protein
MSSRFFNTEGPVRSADHYCLPPLGRWNLEGVLRLIDQRKYFLLHAPRQTGKTSCLLALMGYLNEKGSHRAVYVNLEIAQTTRDDVVQLDGYLAGLSQDRGWLVIFDRRDGLPPLAERVAVEERSSPQGRHIKVVRA